MRFGFSLKAISVHGFCNFIDRMSVKDANFVKEKLDLTGIDWNQLVKNSHKSKLDLKTPLTDGGKPLLQVCIENETPDGQWQLQDLMTTLLTNDKSKCDPNIYDGGDELTLLSFCSVHKKHRSFQLLLRYCSDTILINQTNRPS